MRERELLESILGRAQSPLQGAQGRVLLGPGDDLAMIDMGSETALLVGVDQIVDGLHVHAATTPWDAIGRKAVNRAVSDVAAMAGLPLASVIAVSLPQSASRAQFDALHDGLRAAAEKCCAPLIGGDIAIQRGIGPLTVSVTVLGRPGCGPAVRRKGGRLGDRIWVTGRLGRTLDEDGGGHHLEFTPRVTTAVELQEQLGPALHAMIDLSDGLGRDGARLARASECSMLIQAGAIPCRAPATWVEAMSDGEDYELLFACDGQVPVPEEIDGVECTCIGSVIAEDPRGSLLVEVGDGQVRCGDDMGWDHTTP